MVEFTETAAVLVFAYLLGSIPTALIISTKIKGIDIRSVGDGNMGARNTFHEIGPKFGIIVAIIDFGKGVLPVFIAYILGLNLGWQIVTAVLTILGHDFPVFANFKGGQGTATSLGTMLVLFPLPTLIGLFIYGTVFLFVKRSNIGCGIGGASIALALSISQQWLLLGYTITIFLFIPIKLFIDRPRRRTIRMAKRIGVD
jgi:glycerol-3-phosphate acyltransferase PlsY